MIHRLARFFRTFSSAAGAPAPMPIVVGSPRSGTTMLRLMLDAHPELAVPPETGFLILGKDLAGTGRELRERFFQTVTGFPAEAPGWGDFHIPADRFHARLQEIDPFTAAEGFRLFYRMYAERFGKARWGDKTPNYCRHLTNIGRLLPEARFVHLVRDGRDAAVSLRQRWFSPGHDIAVQAHHWRDNVLKARRQGAACRHYLEVRYEDLVCETEAVLRRICSFAELEFHPDLLRFHERAPARVAEHQGRYRGDGSAVVTRVERLRQQASSHLPPDPRRIGAWRQALTGEEVRCFEEIAGDLLRVFGYAVGAVQTNGQARGQQTDLI